MNISMSRVDLNSLVQGLYAFVDLSSSHKSTSEFSEVVRVFLRPRGNRKERNSLLCAISFNQLFAELIISPAEHDIVWIEFRYKGPCGNYGIFGIVQDEACRRRYRAGKSVEGEEP